MTRDFDAQQSPLWGRSELVRVDLVHLVTYSDRDAETGETHYYFARSNVLFDWENNGTDQEFLPLLQSIGTLSSSINHLPSPNDSGLLSKPLEITLSNAPYGADAARLITTLRAGDALENARIEWTQLALSERPTTARIDLSDLDGNEHTFRYRGRVRQVGPISNDSIVLSCETELPELAWAVSTDDTQTEPDHVGVRWPKVVGEAKKVPCINHDVGFVTTLAEADDGTGTSLVLTDATGIGSSGEGTLGGSIVSWSDKSGNTLTGVEWGLGGSPASNHPAGDIFVEALSGGVVFGVADHEVNAIGDVYALNPFSGQVVRLNTTFTKNVADTVDGDTRATIEFTQAQLKTTLMELAASPEVTDDGSAPGDPDQLQRPICESLDNDGTMSAEESRELPAVADGLSGVGDPRYAMDEDEFFFFRFFRPASGFSRQKIQVELERIAVTGTATLNVYKGRIGIDSTTLLDAQEIEASKLTYTIETTEDAEWISVEVVSTTSVTAAIYEVWQYIDNEIATVHQQATHGNRDGAGEEPRGDPNTEYFDENDSTFHHMLSGAWHGVKFDDPEGGFDTQRIRVLASGLDVADSKFKVQTADGYTTNVAPIWNIDGEDDYEPEPERGASGTKIDFEFESESLQFYLRFDLTSPFTSDHYEISRDLITYGATPTPSIAIAGASVGYGLRLFADVDGYEVPAGASPAYKAGAAGELIVKPCDVLRYIIEELGGKTIDIESYDSCDVNLGVVEIACDLRTMGGLRWEDVAQRVAFESRVTLVEEETATGPVWKMLTADSSYEFPTTSIRHVLLEEDSLVSSASSFDTGSVSPSGDVTLLACVTNVTSTSATPNVPTCAGNGLSWTQVETSLYDDVGSIRERLTVFRASGASPTPGAITFDFDGQTQAWCLWSVHEFEGSDATTNDGVVQSAEDTGGSEPFTVTLDPFAESFNGAFGEFARDSSGTIEATDGFALVSHVEVSVSRQAAMWKPRSDTTVTADGNAVGVWGGIAVEIAAIEQEVPAITEWAPGGFVEVGRALRDELATRFLFPFKPDWSRGDGEEAYTAVLVANEDDNDLTTPDDAAFATAVAAFGNIAAEPIAFRALRDSASVDDVAGYFAHELIRGGALYAIRGVPWWEAYALEVGDIVEVTPPYESSPRKVRTIEYDKDSDTELIELRLVEVE